VLLVVHDDVDVRPASASRHCAHCGTRHYSVTQVSVLKHNLSKKRTTIRACLVHVCVYIYALSSGRMIRESRLLRAPNNSGHRTYRIPPSGTAIVVPSTKVGAVQVSFL
jgi:hypothetical protein